jgi:hypothetical protein
MVARFYVADDRKDDKEVDITGKVLTAGSQRLTKISLFSKADLLKPNPKPIKTVYFEYSYKLCKGVPGNVGTTTEESGKLTLESIYFSYNGNEKQKKNRYKFSYAQNPNYDYNAADRWGNYKPATANQGGLSNADYPYSVSDKTQADLNAAAWTLSSITLPSGGKMDIDYESDDYAYVQDRKASSMYKIIGFGKVTNPSVAQRTNAALYSGTEEFDHVYIEIPYPITSTGIQAKKEIETRYLNSKSNQLFMKLAVVMPSDTRGSGFEMVPMYADIMTEASEPYGVVAGTNGTIIYIKVRPLESQRTPMVQYALQFIKNYLPFKAFPGYDVSENGGLKSIIMALAGMRHNLEALSKGEDNVLISEKTCKFTEPGKSFVRLTNPFYKRYGGGHRVKKVTLRDSWNTLGKGYEATYGQEYKYTTTELINGAVTEISSGVASWEPSIGGEENPHREILRFLNKNKGGPFDFGSVELPLAEMFFPSASVGYSKVEVLSIHRDAVKNAPGRTVSEYFTTKDFPTKSNYTSLADGTANVQYKTSPILQLLKIDMRSAVTVSQGFLVSLNDMNGKLKSQAAYSATDPVNPVTYTQNFYNVNKTSDNKYQFNHTFPVIEKADGFVYDRTIGREVEVMTDFRQHKSETITTNINFNTDFFMVGPFPIAIPAWFQPTFYESNTFRSAAMLKVVNHYAVLDSVVSIDKGSMVSTKNLVYDAETGNALVSRTNNEHNKPQYSFSYPAHWAYPGMGLAYKNIDALYEGLVFRHGILETPIDMSIFESGDEIYVFSETRKGPSKISPCDDMNGSNNLTRNEENKIWAVYTGKTASLTPQFIFIDKDGNPYTADKVKMRIIRSGKRNLLNQGAGGTTSLNSPVRAVFGPIKRIVLDDLTGILQTTAATYKDHWRVDNAFYLFDSAFKRSVTARIKLKTFVLEKNAVVSFNTNELTNAGVAQNADALLMRARGFKNHTLFTDFWLQYKRYAPAIANATVIGAKLKFLSDTKKNLGNNIPLSHYKHIDAGSGLHDSKWSHYTKNTSRNNNGAFNPGQVLLMNTSWPTSNTGWNNLFKDPNRLLHDWNNGGYIPQTMVQPTTGLQTSDKDYIINNNRDERITLPASLIQNWFTSTATQPEIGFRVMKARRSAFFEDMLDNRDAVQCFATLPKTLEDIPPTPVLSVYYYVCDDTTTSTETEPFSIGSPLNQLITCSIVDDRLLECRSKFSRKAMNPYVEGIWGNWRVDTSFVYYGDRKERDPNAQVDTRIGGTIENFKYFWNFAAFLSPLPMQRNYTAYDVWVWNSTITQYNRKGYEIENKDALGRFNAGLYGYNQQLPIAVANNSRYREIMFDGFEDYGYQTASCTETCPPRRHAIINNVALNIDNTQKHSGRYSLKVNPGTPVSFSAPVTSEEEADKPYWMRVKVDSTSYQKIAVTPIGTGFRGKYYFGLSGLNCSGGAATTKLNSGDAASYTVAGEQINFPSFNLPPNTDYNKFAVRWEGYVQPLVSGNYSFLVSADDGYKVSIILPSGTVTLANRWNCFWDQNTTTQSVSLVAGQTYKVTMDYFENSGNEFAQLMWKTPENPNSWQAIPKKQVYTPEKLGDATGTVVTTTAWCTKVDEVQVRGNALTDVLSLIQGRKMVVSTWVKEGGNDCKCTTYDKNSVNISFTGAGDTYSLKPAGSIIEGWQRYEGIIVIPATATMMNVTLNNTTSGQLVYFDDFRIHPFNSNMKSFVYHSSNLRLMSELDENNYASFYEYDDDGTLIRVKKETERGIKTITETRSALQNKIQ